LNPSHCNGLAARATTWAPGGPSQAPQAPRRPCWALESIHPWDSSSIAQANSPSNTKARPTVQVEITHAGGGWIPSIHCCVRLAHSAEYHGLPRLACSAGRTNHRQGRALAPIHRASQQPSPPSGCSRKAATASVATGRWFGLAVEAHHPATRGLGARQAASTTALARALAHQADHHSRGQRAALSSANLQ